MVMLLERCLFCLFSLSACAANAGSSTYAANGVREARSTHQAVTGAPYASTEAEADNRAVCGGTICWTSAWNPTARDAEQAAEHRTAAAKRRVATGAMREAEAAACSGIDSGDRDMSPFYHREDIAFIGQLTEKVRTGKGSFLRTSGARVQFQPVRGLTIERLKNRVACQIARAAAADYVMPELQYCPLTLRGIDARVFAAGGGFTVEITADDAEIVDEILKRTSVLGSSTNTLGFVSP